jgi:hypothetical protein
MASQRDSPSPSDQVAALYEQLETQAAQASEHFVGTRGFAGLLGQVAENAAALTKLGNDAMDLALRNLRLAGRRDVVRLARQLARTEDKLERVLQEVEMLRDQLAGSNGRAPARQANGASAREAESSQ